MLQGQPQGPAMRQSLTAAPITAAIVLVVPSLTHATPIASAVDRVLEVALGAVIGLTISFVLFPSSAYGLAIEAAARTPNLTFVHPEH